VGVGAVAVEAAAEMVVDAAGGHLVQGEPDDLEERFAAGAPPAAEQQAE
jgi:hypothetical protein